ncbi:GNAT family N-acetyltransferase [Halomicronema hongdechloris]|uniref:GNAT family N-acetyltransferase n=1 Tax=Halomicronema hongdechloris TaxID=1209493 RepID=UPI0009BB89C2|nr:GNAT family N-acetyltransferase [Halomicronema hongdechloris]
MHIRLAAAADVPALAELFRQSVLAVAPQRYTLEQTQAWVSFATDLEAFRAFILAVTTYVAEDATGIVGFAGIGQDGHVASAYVRPDCIHRGIGSALMQRLLAYADSQGLQRLYGEASEFSLGLFLKFGFRQYDTEVVERQGVRFSRYLVEKLRRDNSGPESRRIGGPLL